MKSEVQEMQNEIQLREDEYGSMDVNPKRERYSILQNEIETIKNKMAKSSGSKEELMRQLKETKKELKEKKFKDIELRVRTLTIHHKTVEMAVKDLERYHGALDSGAFVLFFCCLFVCLFVCLLLFLATGLFGSTCAPVLLSNIICFVTLA